MKKVMTKTKLTSYDEVITDSDITITHKGLYIFEQVIKLKRDFDEVCEEYDFLFNEDGTPKNN